MSRPIHSDDLDRYREWMVHADYLIVQESARKVIDGETLVAFKLSGRDGDHPRDLEWVTIYMTKDGYQIRRCDGGGYPWHLSRPAYLSPEQQQTGVAVCSTLRSAFRHVRDIERKRKPEETTECTN